MAQPAPTAPSAQRTAHGGHGGHGGHGAHAAGRSPSRSGNRALLGVAAAALTVIIGLGAWALTGDDDKGGGPGPNASGGPQQSRPAKPQAAKLQVANVGPAEEAMNGRHDNAIGKRLDLVTDGRTGDAWETQTYADVNFGRYAKGLGVVLDMGRPVQVSSVKVHVPEGAGGTLQLKVGDSRNPSALPAAGRHVTTPGENTIQATGQARGRYVVVWFTKLPSTLKGKISEISVFGSAGN
jgi:hypothetical protein